MQTPVAAAAVMRALQRAATGGDSQAAGTLLRWTQAYPAIDTAVQLDQLNEETRDQLLRRLLRELDDADPPDGHSDQSTDGAAAQEGR